MKSLRQGTAAPASPYPKSGLAPLFCIDGFRENPGAAGRIWVGLMSTASHFETSLTDAKKAASKAARKAGLSRLSPRLKWILIAAGGLILIAIAWHVIAGLLAGHKKPPPPPQVSVATAKKADVTVMAHTIATVVSPATVQVDAQVTGILKTAYFQEGQLVHKGDPLFLIDPAPYQNAAAQAQSTLAKDQATAQSDLNDEKRYIALYAVNATSQQMRDQAIAAAKSAVAQVNADQAGVNIAAENLSYTKIVSPIDGKTGPIVIQPGNLITVAGATPLVTITQVQPIKVSFFLPQNQLIQIQNQMNAGKLQAIVPMPDAPGGKEMAAVDFIGNIVSSTTGTIELRATFANDDMRLVPGQSVNVGITINQLPGATVVPRDAVNVGPNGSYIYTVDKTMVVHQVNIQMLNDDGTNDAVKGNIKPGDTVITQGQISVVPGSKVSIQNGKGSGAPS
jgi:membrane fusion protein, multidrug efflux system